MPIFKWEAETKKGKTVKGELEAVDEKIARLQLRRKNLNVLKIKQKPKDLFENVSFLQPKITHKDLVIFTRQFSTMIDAGLPLIQGLTILAEQCENKTFRKVLQQITRDVEGGSSLADSLKKHPQVFNDLYVNLVAAGETGGILDTILQRLAFYIEKAEKLKSRIKGAMTYPAVVVAIAVLVVGVIMVFVIPVFKELFESFGSALPAPTQMVVDMSDFVKTKILYLIAAVGIIVYLFRLYRKSVSGRKQTDAIALKLPIFGPLLKKVAVARFTRTLGTMISSGVPILDALDIVARTSGNVILEQVIYEVRSSISEGQTIADPLSESGVFPAMVVQMIAVGEATGALDTMLEKIAEFYDQEVDVAVDALTSLLEPMLLLFLGGTIGGLVVALYLPIFKMAGAIGG
ncbi:MAG: pilus assembly protein PilC [Deltaproteobacteria bacterium CG_4_8_14_3_um_filter_51_11]|nr:type II secretion system F family protein [bacterium]OIP41686.1 MAG: pilus assembly protein PilC [Desulfobacteraceae bacterium CG2_30_51_40]PIP45538.1 MAG: pilus assembly protein PilC [Deltaproteobacteria bacterium CG23_combo_of_CG06-09_8_20_14_all_51_20]PIX20092.1 MAG: pilus assembly protein PilC [Deltaproteobacteria bacterium CG_4_8_14_3_um_filter_51_11]PIY22797.1 MAG: pilus assembly protein PilC [Deltaproteobacteria bacterium CG_4_10_14_3_um_filter_51_14]PJB37287.1 MAG: pilus assembly pr